VALKRNSWGDARLAYVRDGEMKMGQDSSGRNGLSAEYVILSDYNVFDLKCIYWKINTINGVREEVGMAEFLIGLC